MTTIYRFRALASFALLAAALALPAFAQGERPMDTTRKEMRAGTGGLELDNALAPAPPPPALQGRGNPAAFGGGGMKMNAASPTLGATVGGAQDIGYARTLIESGKVPRFIDFSPEGLYSEHDIPTPSSACDQKLCLSLGYGYAPTADDRSNALFVHLGMSSNITAATFRRPALQLAVVIDRSGSMENANLAAVKTALRSLLRQLTPEDELMVVQFNDEAGMLLEPTRITDPAAIMARIDSMTADGGTDIEAGLRMGFSGLSALPSRPGALRRVMLFTDAMPNTGRTDSAGFRELTARYAAEGIGLSAFGVGVDFGQELAYHISNLRGGNFFYLESPEKIAKVFDTEFDYLVTPLVYDLDIRIATPAGLKLKAVYGLPGWKPGSPDAELHIPTVFLSSNRGAIILRYEADGSQPLVLRPDAELASGTLSFTDTDGSAHTARTVLRHESRKKLSPGTQFYTHDGMRMAVALTNIYFGLRDGCILLSEGKQKEAMDVVSRARSVALLENLALNDEGLAAEIRLLDRLAKNMEAGGAVRSASGTKEDKERRVR